MVVTLWLPGGGAGSGSGSGSDKLQSVAVTVVVDVVRTYLGQQVE